MTSFADSLTSAGAGRDTARMSSEIPPPPGVPAGWYPNGDLNRYWDGQAWTEHTAPLPAQQHQTAPQSVAANAPSNVSRDAGRRSVLAQGMISASLSMKIYHDGTFSTGPLGGKPANAERLLAFDHDADSMRRKSVAGRGGAALLTGGISLVASNNRGVVYVTVHGERSGLKTHTTRNPPGTLLTGVRTLKAAAIQFTG